MSKYVIKSQSNCHQKQLILFPYPFVVILSLSIRFSDQDGRHGDLYCRAWTRGLNFIHNLLLPSIGCLVVLSITNTVPWYSIHRELSNGISHYYESFCTGILYKLVNARGPHFALGFYAWRTVFSTTFVLYCVVFVFLHFYDVEEAAENKVHSLGSSGRDSE